MGRDQWIELTREPLLAKWERGVRSGGGGFDFRREGGEGASWPAHLNTIAPSSSARTFFPRTGRPTRKTPLGLPMGLYQRIKYALPQLALQRSTGTLICASVTPTLTGDRNENANHFASQKPTVQHPTTFASGDL